LPSRPPGTKPSPPTRACWEALAPAVHVSLDAPGGLARLLVLLRSAGAHEQAAALLAHVPAVYVPLDHPGDVAYLLQTLRPRGQARGAGAPPTAVNTETEEMN